MAKSDKQPFPININAIPEPAPYSGELQSFHRNDCLVVDNGWVGYLQDVDKEDGKALSSIAIADTESKSRSLHSRKGCYINLYQKKLKSRPNTRKNGKP
jgi:hypothetical protein